MLQVWLQNQSLRRDALDSLRDMAEDKEDDPFLVRWAPGDARDPKNWSLTRKWAVTLMVSAVAVVVAIAGSINAGADKKAAQEYGVSAEVMALQTGMFLVGFGVSAPALGPLSELGGRMPVYVIPLLIFSAFELGSGFAPNIQTRVVLRFLAGTFGAAPMSNAGGSVADMSGPLQRTYLFPVFSLLGLVAPPLGAVFGGWIGERADQGWCDWVAAASGVGTALVLVLFMPETLSSQVLKARARELRRVTGDRRYMTPLERRLKSAPHGFARELLNAVKQPVLFLVTEPITLCFSLYLTIVYIVMFGDLESYPLIFEIYGWDSGRTGSVFAAVCVGMCVVGAATPLFYWHYRGVVARAEARGLAAPPAEVRLNVAMIGTWCLPISLFWAGWTAYRSISPWSLIASQFVFGIGALSCYNASYMYIIDVYQVNAASPLASLTLLRYVVSGGGSVMWSRPMFRALGNHWALSLLGFLALAISVVPYLFYYYGPAIRERSRYAMSQ